MKLFTSPCRHHGHITLLALGIALLASGLLAAVTAAHGPEVLVKTDPPDGAVLEQSPAQVKAWFNTELDTRSSTLHVVDINHHQVDNGDGGVDLNNPDHATMVVSLPQLPEGVYIVRWTAVTARDGDLVGGVFTFGVSNSGIAPDQISTAQTPPADNGAQTPSADAGARTSPADRSGGWPLALMAAGLGVLLSVMIGGVLYARSVRGS
jgi:methionine-rich copper-binding protein CopC